MANDHEPRSTPLLGDDHEPKITHFSADDHEPQSLHFRWIVFSQLYQELICIVLFDLKLKAFDHPFGVFEPFSYIYYTVTPCSSLPCHNDGRCIVVDGNHICVCPPGFNGPECQGS